MPWELNGATGQWEWKEEPGATGPVEDQPGYRDPSTPTQATPPPDTGDINPENFVPGTGPGQNVPGAYNPGASEQKWSIDPQWFTYINRGNFATPGYEATNQRLSELQGYRATPQLGPAAMSGQSDYLTQGQRGLQSAYEAMGQAQLGGEAFRAGQGTLAGTLGGFAGQGLAGSGYAGDVRGLVGGLQGMASGQTSLARQQVEADTQAAIARQRSLAAGARPGQGALAAFGAARNIAGLELEGASRAAREGLAERLGALGQLGGVLGTATGQDLQRAQAERQLQLGAAGQLAGLYGQGREQDLATGQTAYQLGLGRLGAQAGLYGQQAGQEAQYGLANQAAQNQFQLQQLEADLRSRGLDDARIQQALQQQLQLNQLALEGTMGYEAERTRRLGALTGGQQGDGKGFWDYLTAIGADVGSIVPG